MNKDSRKVIKSDKFDLAKLHLDRFWQEIFWRRENEQKITVWTIGLFAAVLALVYGSERDLELNQKIVLCCLPLILGILAAWYLFQNWRKDKEVARLIVRLNQALGAWEENYPIYGEKLYPNAWKKWGIDTNLTFGARLRAFGKDYISLFYFFSVILAMGLCVAGILIK